MEVKKKGALEADPRRPESGVAGGYPYLLGKLAIERANHLWSADVTYISLLVAGADAPSYRVIGLTDRWLRRPTGIHFKEVIVQILYY